MKDLRNRTSIRPTEIARSKKCFLVRCYALEIERIIFADMACQAEQFFRQWCYENLDGFDPFISIYEITEWHVC